MKTLTISALLFALALVASVGCGSGNSGGTGGTPNLGGGPGLGGAPGTSGMDGGGGGGFPDVALASDVFTSPESGLPVDKVPGEAGSGSSLVNCALLTEAQCNDLLINPPTLAPGVLAQDPGPNPPVGYPACSAQ